MSESVVQSTACAGPRRRRPALFRALGGAEPPASVEVDGQPYVRLSVLKHDSWAATAVYEQGDVRIVCKFNRRHPILGLPVPWLGAWLARREARMFQRLAGDPNVPAGCGPVHVNGQVARHAVSHVFIPGRTLLEITAPSREVIAQLQGLLARLKQNGIAYVDLHKLDNILVGDDGKPYLIDFQISVWLPRIWPVTWLLHFLHQLDRYHLLKHVSRLRPDLCDEREHRWVQRRPLLIRAHRCIAIPFRQMRRALFVRLGVRTGTGESFTELRADPPVPPAVRVTSPVLAADRIESSHARSSIDLFR